MAPNTTTLITHEARLCLSADFAPFAARIERRMRQRLDRLLGGPGCEGAAWYNFQEIAFVRCGDEDGPAYDLRVTGADPDAALAELARLALALVLRNPVSRIAWLPENAVLDRDTFLEAMSPELPRPVRRAGLEAIRFVPQPGESIQDAGDREMEDLLRTCLRRPIDRSEADRMRRQLNLPAPERRAARVTLAITSAVLAMNASGAMANVLSIL